MPVRSSALRRLPNFVLDRPRLLKRLEASDAQVLALIAPAGYGKTTLLAQFAASPNRPVAWLTLDDSASDAAWLAASVANTLMRAFPRAKFAAWHSATALGALPAGLAIALATDVNRLQRNALVVLDRIERLSLESARWLEAWLGALLDGHQICLAGYADSTFSVARYVADGALLLEAKELAFTPQETAAYLKSRGFVGNTLDVYKALEGWAVGLALLAANQEAVLEPKGLMLEVLKRLPAPIGQTIPEAAVLEVWDEQLALEVGCAMPKGWLSMSLKVGLPLVAAGKGLYRPHTVLLEALTEELRLQPRRFSSLHTAVAERAEAAGNDVLALQHFHLAGFEAGILRVLERVVPTLFARREYNRMRNQLELLPEARLTDLLKTFYANNLFETQEASRGQQLLFDMLKNGYQNPFVYSILAVVECRRGHGKEALDYAQQGLALLGTEMSPTRVRLLVAKSSAFQLLGESQKDLLAAKEAVQIAETLQDSSLLSLALSLIAPSYGDIGNRLACETTFKRSLELSAQLGFSIRQIQDYNNFASYLGDWGRVEEALQMADLGIPIARKENSVFYPILLGTRGLQQWRLGNLEAAETDLEEALGLCPAFSLDHMANMFTFFLVQVKLFLKKLGAAERHLLDLKQKPNINPEELAFLEGLLAFSVSDFSSAHTFLTAVGAQVSVWDAPRKKMYLAEIARQQHQLSFEMITDLVASLEQLGHYRSLTLDLFFLSGLYQHCLAKNWYPDIFQEALNPKDQSHLLLVPLEAQLLGKNNFLLAGLPLPTGLAKSKELLAWLVLHGSSTRDELIRGTWGQLNSANLEYFKVSMRKLRMAFKDHSVITFEAVVFENGVYSLHSRLQILCSAKKILDVRDDPPTDPAQLEALFSSYRGAFMLGVDTPWVLELRQILLDTVVMLGEKLGVLLLESDQFKAARILRRVRELDPLSEVA